MSSQISLYRTSIFEKSRSNVFNILEWSLYA